MTPKRKPTHRIAAWQQSTRRYATVGAGWLGADGRVSIMLNVGVTLSWNDGLILNAFPVDDKRPWSDDPRGDEDMEDT